MPYKEKEIQKLYYSIGEVADMFDVSASLIRFWEKEFAVLNPKKNKKGNRQFTKDDLAHLKIIYHLVKEKGYTLQGAKVELKKDKKELSQKIDLVNRLQKVREELLKIKGSL